MKRTHVPKRPCFIGERHRSRSETMDLQVVLMEFLEEVEVD